LTGSPHLSPLARVWGLRENLTAYDVAYVGLAETLDALLLTADVQLSSSFTAKMS
jgi:predicted nucleic acid-binding protein